MALALNQAAPYAVGSEPGVVPEGQLEALRAHGTRIAHGDGFGRLFTCLCRVLGNGKPLVRIGKATPALSVPVHQRDELALAHFARAA
jgi:hypothetical protein